MIIHALALLCLAISYPLGVIADDGQWRKADIGDGWYSYYLIQEYETKLTDEQLVWESYFQFDRMRKQHTEMGGSKGKWPVVTTAERDGPIVYFAAGITGPRKKEWTEVNGIKVEQIKKTLEQCQKDIAAATNDDSRHRAYAKCSEVMAAHYRMLRWSVVHPDKLENDMIPVPWVDPDGDPIVEVTVGKPPTYDQYKIFDPCYSLTNQPNDPGWGCAQLVAFLNLRPIVNDDYKIPDKVQQFVANSNGKAKFDPIKFKDIEGDDLKKAIASGAKDIDRSKIVDHGEVDCKVALTGGEKLRRRNRKRAHRRGKGVKHRKLRRDGASCSNDGGALTFATDQCKMPDEPEEDEHCEL